MARGRVEARRTRFKAEGEILVAAPPGSDVRTAAESRAGKGPVALLGVMRRPSAGSSLSESTMMGMMMAPDSSAVA